MSTHFSRSLVNLAEPRLGAEVVFASDEFFAAKERLIEPAAPVFVEDKYDDNGKWMDGWESRRRRDGGHDLCIVKLGQPGLVQALSIDTRFFTGNFPPRAAVEATRSDERVPGDEALWTWILPRMELSGDSEHYVEVHDQGPWTHLRLNIYPDGGVARLRVYGRFRPDWSRIDKDRPVDLAAIENGGSVLACNDEHYGRLSNILAPGRGVNMGDGWETRRRREPGHDWGIIRLGRPARIDEVRIDTAFFKGNFPHRCGLQASVETGVSLSDLPQVSASWPVLLPAQPMTADNEHRFKEPIVAHDPVRLIRVNLIPDGGISRLRLFGRLR